MALRKRGWQGCLKGIMPDNPRLKILVIDDEKMVSELIKAKLEREGFEVALAGDGLEGLKAIPSVRPDLIILDILMPRMDGFQFYKELKQNEETRHIPVLVMTARGAMRDSFEGLGVESFLSKPFEPDELIDQINKVLAVSKKGQMSKTALIAGSDNQKLQTMRMQLEAKGYKVDVASDGPRALGKVLQLLPDLFVVQYDMPEMDSDSIIKILNSYPDAKKISVVVYSPIKTKAEIESSSWGRFIGDEKKKDLRSKESPIKIIDKFDVNRFVDKIKDFL